MAEPNALEVPCCPPLSKDTVCDVLDFHYRLTHPTTVVVGNRRVTVEVLIHARFERCPGPMSLGDLVYSTTLLPGEKVKLFTSDRRGRFSFDSSTKVSYRNEQTSEERYYAASLHDFMSDVSVRDSGSASSSSRGSAKGHAGTSGAIQSFFGGASVDVSGSYDASRLVHSCGSYPSMPPAATGAPRWAHAPQARSRSVKSRPAPTPRANRRITSNRPRASSPIPTSATR